ncbi:PREDICTED: pathogen-related protein-like [Camelina sativa]|uniref:Pathogen-related protein-like n=1 Tax=Camelina sativa TaxID=90675 RepID=A0ABM0W2A1_CAMSA|nr:PREDICTED: pathogen-related protein-like [Camelina sativa]
MLHKPYVATREERDKYRSVLEDARKVQWRYGYPPDFNSVNQLFEEGQTKVWPEGSLEETVQNAIKSWEMEFSHKVRLQDFKTINPEKFKLFVNGNYSLCGFAWEVLSVYSGPPVIAFKFRHWGYFEGTFKGHAPTGEMVQFLGLGVLKVDESLRAEEIEIYYDPGELFGGLLKGPPISETKTTDTGDNTAEKQSCPFTQ